MLAAAVITVPLLDAAEVESAPDLVPDVLLQADTNSVTAVATATGTAGRERPMIGFS
jgi:hypothetical protein